MSTESAVLEATASPETPIMDVSRGPLVNLTVEQRKEFRTTGTLPKADSATAPVKVEGESEAPRQQEKPKSEPKPRQTAEERIAEIREKAERTIEQIRAGAGLNKPKAETPAPAKSEPVSAKPTPEDKNADGTDKFATHEEYIEALVDWKSEQRESAKSEKLQKDAADKALNEKLEDGRTRYADLDDVIQTAAKEIYEDKDIPGVVKAMMNDSDVTVDLLYTLGSDKEGFAKFLKMAKNDPGKAIRYIALTESLIAQELESKTAPATEEAPAKPRTQAPKPPAEAGGRASTPPDTMQAALEGSGGKLNAQMKAEFTRQALARMK